MNKLLKILINVGAISLLLLIACLIDMALPFVVVGYIIYRIIIFLLGIFLGEDKRQPL